MLKTYFKFDKAVKAWEIKQAREMALTVEQLILKKTKKTSLIDVSDRQIASIRRYAESNKNDFGNWLFLKFLGNVENKRAVLIDSVMDW